MKTRICLLTATLALSGISLATAQDEFIGPPAPPAKPSAVTVPPSDSAVTATPPATTENVRVIQMPKLSLPPVLDQVVKLSESGADESVIRAYVEKAAPPYRITGNEIVQMRDLGISQGVIMSLIEHSQSAMPGTVAEVIAPQANVSSTPVETVPVQTNVAEAPLSEDVTPFYDTLAPYGSWLDVAGYGAVWQPTVVVVNPGWRPYCDNGYWLWSDHGWYWNSYYSWGWAPFHYGRWFNHGHHGWLWCPDRTWGSSWVSWRNSASHCGWAPLPPGAHFGGHGWSHHGKQVGVDHGFGLSASDYTFVSAVKFGDRRVASHALGRHEAQTAFQRTSVANNYAVGANNRIINHGVGRDTIAAASGTPVREVAVRDLPSGGAAPMPDRVSRIGNTDVVYKPGARISVPRHTTATPAVNRLNGNATGTRVAASATGNRVAVSANPQNRALYRPPASQAIVGGAAPRQVYPARNQNFSLGGSRLIQGGAAGNVMASRRLASSASPQNRVYSSPSAPAAMPRVSAPRAAAPSVSAPRMSAPRQSAPSYSGRSMSSGGGGGSLRSGGGGGGSRGGGGGGAVSQGLRR